MDLRPSPSTQQWISLLVRLVVGGVWIVAGAAKLTDPLASVQAVQAYELLPTSVAETVGYTLPAVEVVVGLALVVGALTRGAAVISALLFVAFVIGIASVWARGMEIDCGCFGGGGADPDAASSYPVDIARDVALLLGSVWLVWAGPGRFALDSVLFRRSRPDPDGDDPDGADHDDHTDGHDDHPRTDRPHDLEGV